ncbi:MAG: hypothetical protein AAFP81_20170 [Pseudomonadota bacterium]
MSEAKFKPRPEWRTAEEHIEKLQGAILKAHKSLKDIAAIDEKDAPDPNFKHSYSFGVAIGIAMGAVSTLEIYSDMVREGGEANAA